MYNVDLRPRYTDFFFCFGLTQCSMLLPLPLKIEINNIFFKKKEMNTYVKRLH